METPAQIVAIPAVSDTFTRFHSRGERTWTVIESAPCGSNVTKATRGKAVAHITATCGRAVCLFTLRSDGEMRKIS